MPQYLKEYGEAVAGNGFLIVPLPPGSKGPNRKGWPKFEADAAQVRRWYSNGSAHDGIGVLARHTPAIDVDILDGDAASDMSDILDEIFAGETLLTRIGRAPKFLIPFRSDEPFKKISSNVYTDGTNDHKVEILGDGQQWVAYHVHPETGKPYQWVGGTENTGILSVPRSSLPVLGRDDAQRVIDAFETLAAGRVSSGAWKRKASPAQAPNDRDTRPVDDPFADAPLTFHNKVNALAMKSFGSWVPELFPEAVPYQDGFRVPSASLGRAFEEDISIVSKGIKDFGVADMGDPRGGRRSPVALVAEWRHSASTDEAANWLCKQLGVDPVAAGAPVAHKPRVTSDNPFAIHKWEDYKQNYLSTPWIVKGVLPQAEVGILYGQSGSGKTFFVLDLAATIARGAQWRGRKVSACRVVYVAAEAREGVKKRMDAYDRHVCAEGDRPDIIASAPNLLSSDAGEMAKAIGHAGLIILDTMAASHSGDENSAKDMGLFLAACKDLSHATGAMVLAVHHTGKEESKGMRGSSALFAGADFVMEVFKNDKEHGAVLSKSRDDTTGTSFSFELRRVVVGQDDEGDDVTTCVVEPIQKEVVKATKAKKPQKLANESDSRYDFSREMLAIIERLVEESKTGKVHKDQIFEALLLKYPGKMKKNLAVVLLRLEQLGAIRQTLDWYEVAEDDLDLG